MLKHYRSALWGILSVGLLAGCASTPYTAEPFQAASVDTTAYAPTVDAFVVLLDASSSMGDKYQDRKKFYTAKDLVANFNQTVPPLGYNAALVAFGTGSCMGDEEAKLLYGPSPYQRADFAAGLDSLECAGGITPMAAAFDTASQELDADTGDIAVIIVSDFQDLDSTAVTDAATRLKAQHGDRLCLHTIQVGNSADAGKVVDDITSIRECGSSVNADDIAAPDAMANYVADTLLGPLQYTKNTVSATALFDFNKAIVKEQGRAELHNLDMDIKSKGAKVADIDVIGYTDSIGSAEYNQGLSVRRATAVKEYMVSEGIDADIIDVSGKGESDPVASNDTDEGRAMNRRVEIHVGIAQPTN